MDENKIKNLISGNLMVATLLSSFEIAALKTAYPDKNMLDLEIKKLYEKYAQNLIDTLNIAGFQIVDKIPEAYLK